MELLAVAKRVWVIGLKNEERPINDKKNSPLSND
jgi:hypothetical protein